MILGPQSLEEILLVDCQNFWTRLGISLLLDSHFCLSLVEPQTSHSIPSTQNLQETVRAFKSSLQVSPEKAREIECNTRQQCLSQLWVDTPPDNLVLSIIQPKKFSTSAMRYGIENEQIALEKYTTYQRNNGHPDILVSPSGFYISSEYPYLGASPDGAVNDTSNMQQPLSIFK